MSTTKEGYSDDFKASKTTGKKWSQQGATTCPDCKGAGDLEGHDGSRVWCERCNGTGKIAKATASHIVRDKKGNVKLSLEPEDQRSYQHGMGEAIEGLLHGMDNLIEDYATAAGTSQGAKKGHQTRKKYQKRRDRWDSDPDYAEKMMRTGYYDKDEEGKPKSNLAKWDASGQGGIDYREKKMKGWGEADAGYKVSKSPSWYERAFDRMSRNEKLKVLNVNGITTNYINKVKREGGVDLLDLDYAEWVAGYDPSLGKRVNRDQLNYAINRSLGREAYSQKQLVKMAQQGKQPPKSWWDNMYNRILKHEKAKARAKKGKYSLKANRHPELIKARARQITGFQWHVNMVLKK